MKAKFIGKVYDRYGKYVDLEYEYKGHTYFIRNNFSGNAMDESLYQQHKEEQERIDNLINNNNKTETKKEGSFDFEKIWNMLGWED